MNAKEKAALDAIVTVGEAIKALGSVPSGHLYAQLMPYMSLETYNKIIAILVRAGGVKEERHLLTWIGG